MPTKLAARADADGGVRAADFAADITSPVSRVDKDERHALLRRALVDLPGNDRRILELRHFEGLGNAACAAALGLTEKAASIRYVRALERLHRKLAEGGLVAAAIGLVACAVALALGMVRTARAQAATHREAVQTAQALVSALATVERGEPDPRDAKLRRALETAEALAVRYPDDATIREALETLRKAHEFRTKRLARPHRAIPGRSSGNAAPPTHRRQRQH